MAYTTINKGSSYFNTILYTGTGSSNARTGVGFQPDWVWIKGRSGATDHGLYDAVRGVQNQLESNTDTAQTTEATGLTAFGTDGFTVGALAQLNTSAATYVAWNWLANNTSGSSNTAGSITSTVAANTTAGFSIVTYTGTGATATVGHGLGSTPKMIIFKKRSGADNWVVYHVSVGNTAYLLLDQTSGSTSSSGMFNNTSPTSSVFTVSTAGPNNGSGATFVAYCFAEVKGYSKFGSYTGNGNANGAFVYTGFKPAWIMIKTTASGDGWLISDNKRSISNVVTNTLGANNAFAESSFGSDFPIDILSNGFKLRNTQAANNSSGVSYIYMAFAENPFVSSTQIPTTAR
jgi:hypothetical protein